MTGLTIFQANEHPHYFRRLRLVLQQPLEMLAFRGNPECMPSDPVAIFSSRACPGEIILKTFDLARRLRDLGVPVIGGFHSPMEQECLRILLRGEQTVAWCRARSIHNMRVASEWKKPLHEGRLLIVSPFPEHHNRISKARAVFRNRLVAAMAGAIFFAYAAPGGNIEALAAEADRFVINWGKRLFTFDSPHNQGLVQMGAEPVSPESFAWEPGKPAVSGHD